jgi:hypothetical protein
MAIVLNPKYLDMYRGDTQKFNVTPGTLENGFNSGTDVLKFTAAREWGGTPEITLDSPPPGIEILTGQLALVTITPGATAGFPFETVELKFGVEVVRGGSEKYTLIAGILLVKPVVRQ